MAGQTPHFATQKKDRTFRILAGLALVLIVASLLFIEGGPIANWVATFENLGYDFQVKQMHKPLSKDSPITIVEIDDQSLSAEGRWPWPRKVLAELVSRLYQQGAAVVALDMSFPDPERNIAQEVIAEASKQYPAVASQLNSVKETFDYDRVFAKSLEIGPSVLGMIFLDEKEITGQLPSPLFQLSATEAEQLDIPDKAGYLANLVQLSQAVKHQGFINASPDAEGILRFTPLLLRRGTDIYGSLSLIAASLYLLSEKIDLATAQYGDFSLLEGIHLDQLFIPTDPQGRILIPFRGPPYSFSYVSALDVMKGKVEQVALKGKLVLVGCTASAIGDLSPSPIGPTFPGVEIQASVAQGIIDGYLPFKPTWGRGFTLTLILALGTASAVILPFLGILATCCWVILVPLVLLLANYWIWSSLGIVVSVVLPIALVLLLFLLNIVWGYLFETDFAKAMKSIFGQYVPSAYLEEMIQQGGEFSLEGESKELSVLFADIRNFTSLSEKMNAKELKTFLNRYFDPMTEIIFQYKGTVDKYVGDMIMAFWGAPLDDPKHALDAVSAAITMQRGLSELNRELQRDNLPEIQIGIGVNTGWVNVGDMGSKFRRAYTAIGDAINLGSRLEGLTKFYHAGILIGEESYRQTKDAIVYRKVDRIKVKGKEVAVDVYSPICLVGESSSEIEAELNGYHRAWDAYAAQKWDEAEKLFLENGRNYPNNRALYEIYLERIRAFRAQPPGPTWDGAFVHLFKF